MVRAEWAAQKNEASCEGTHAFAVNAESSSLDSSTVPQAGDAFVSKHLPFLNLQFATYKANSMIENRRGPPAAAGRAPYHNVYIYIYIYISKDIYI